LFLEIKANIGGFIDLIPGFVATVPASDVGELKIDLPGAGVLQTHSEAVGPIKPRRSQDIAKLGAPVVVDVVDDCERERMVEIRVIVLRRPLYGLPLCKRGPNREGGPDIVVIVAFVGESGIGIALPRIALEPGNACLFRT
jgi:hypothetical protein